jgi:hypothetical protein
VKSGKGKREGARVVRKRENEGRKTGMFWREERKHGIEG